MLLDLKSVPLNKEHPEDKKPPDKSDGKRGDIAEKQKRPDETVFPSVGKHVVNEKRPKKQVTFLKQIPLKSKDFRGILVRVAGLEPTAS